MSWIDPEEIPVRDDGADAVAEVTDADGNVVAPAVEARPAWPKAHQALIKAFASGEDVANFSLWAQLSHDWRVTAQGEDAAASMVRFDAGVAVVAVMLVSLVGKQFIDSTTGEPLAITGTPLERMAAVRKLPVAVINFLADAVSTRLSSDPLGLKGANAGRGN